MLNSALSNVAVVDVRGRKLIPSELWEKILASIPIPCVDIIVYRTVNRERQVLLGYRMIPPYADCWALPGGRIVKGESLRDTANRQLREIGLRPTGNYALVGVYPVNFRHRSDVTISLSTQLRSREEPRPTKELIRYAWRPLGHLPSRLGGNYRAMLRDFDHWHYHVR